MRCAGSKLSSSSRFVRRKRSSFVPLKGCCPPLSLALSSSTSTPLSWWQTFKSAPRMFKHIYAGDDHINPQKILERRYIYFVLLATKIRSMRLLLQEEQPEQNVVCDRAIEELDAKGIDRMTNVQLRREMQLALEPQVLETFQAFDKIDQQLGLVGPRQEQESNLFANMDWSLYRTILREEYERSGNDMEPRNSTSSSNDKSSRNDDNVDEIQRRQLAFLQRKKEALELLLEFHGWADGLSLTTTTTKMTNGRSGNQHTLENDQLEDAFGTNLSTVTNHVALERMRSFQTINLCRSALIRQELGYSVVTLQSLIPGAGRGVFLDGTAITGSLVSFVPGEMWPKEHLLTTDPEIMEHFEGGDDDCQISLRFDDYVLDSRQSPVTVLSQPGSMNPWAIGHMINHPPANTLPNCQSTMLNFTERMMKLQDPLSQYAPNYYARPPGWQSEFFMPEPIWMHGLCLVSRRDVHNEELLYDYRLQSNETPRWYSVVKYGDDDSNDEQVVFFRDDWMN